MSLIAVCLFIQTYKYLFQNLLLETEENYKSQVEKIITFPFQVCREWLKEDRKGKNTMAAMKKVGQRGVVVHASGL